MALTQLVADRPDTPRSAYSLLPRLVTIAIVGSLVVVAALGWAYTIRGAQPMSDMVAGLGQVGATMTMGMATTDFLAMWAIMMVAMMAPTVAPMVLAYRAALPERGRSVAPTATFAFGFLLVWAATAVVALVPYRLILQLPASAANSRWLPILAGAVLMVVGGLQFTTWKVRCLRACRRPTRFLSHLDNSGEISPALRAGIAHGWHCLGCCWALMVVFLVVGVMNLVWMAVISAIFLIDKHWSHGEGFTRVVGIAFVVLGLAVIAYPDLLAHIAGVVPPT